MLIKTSLVPSLTWYTEYSGCSIKEALLYALQHAPNNTLSLVDIGNIKVNWNRLLGSYWDAIRNLRREWFKIDTLVYHDPYRKITKSSYHLSNPLYNPER